jgi:hypothetical protein
MKLTEVSIDRITLDPDVQSRSKIDDETVAEYVEVIDALPPVDVHSDGSTLWLAVGWPISWTKSPVGNDDSFGRAFLPRAAARIAPRRRIDPRKVSSPLIRLAIFH